MQASGPQAAAMSVWEADIDDWLPFLPLGVCTQAPRQSNAKRGVVRVLARLMAMSRLGSKICIGDGERGAHPVL